MLLSKATGRPPKSLWKASAWLPCDFSDRHSPTWIPVSSLSFLAYIWQRVAWVMEGCLHPGVQKFLVGVITAPACGDFLTSEAGSATCSWDLSNSGTLIAHTGGLMRRGDSHNFRCSCECPTFKGSCVDELLSESQ